MPSHGKKYTDARKLVDRNKLHEPEEAVELVKQTATARFDETIECAVRLGVDPRHAEQVVRGAVVLPHGTGKETRVLVFAKGDKAREAEEAGADVVGAEDLVAQIQGGWLEFDVAVATPDVMGVIGRIGRILGPRGLMPNPRTGTVTFDVKEAVEEIKAGKIEYRAERAGIVHAPIGKASFEPEKLLDNFYALMDALIRARPAAAKGTYVRSVSLASTMGPGVKIAPTRITRTVQEER